MAKRSTGSRLRPWLFLIGLVALIASAGGYVWILGPLRNAGAAERHLAKNIGRIMTLDEILTMSARVAAASHDMTYEARYNAHVDELDEVIKRSIVSSNDPGVVAAVTATDDANQRLVAMETESFRLDHAGKFDEAYALLGSGAYRADKETYEFGMHTAFARLEQLHASQTALFEKRSMVLQLSAVLSLGLILIVFAFEQKERRRRAHEVELEATVERRTGELARANRAMRLVLDNVQQALVALDAEGCMTSERSAITARWLGCVRDHISLAEYVMGDPSAELDRERAEVDQRDLLSTFEHVQRRGSG
jgi:hypothetical protein